MLYENVMVEKSGSFSTEICSEEKTLGCVVTYLDYMHIKEARNAEVVFYVVHSKLSFFNKNGYSREDERGSQYL